MLMLIWFVSIKVFNAEKGLTLVMKSTGLWCPWIYFISVILYYLYDWHKLITSIISHFSWVILSLTRQLYNNFESIHRISGIANTSIFFKITEITISMSNPCTIPYILIAKTLYISYLYFINDKYIIFALLVVSTK